MAIAGRFGLAGTYLDGDPGWPKSIGGRSTWGISI
jgi:hypothetical protein